MFTGYKTIPESGNFFSPLQLLTAIGPSRYYSVSPYILTLVPSAAMTPTCARKDIRNVHRLQFLEKQLRRVRDVHLRDLGVVSAYRAVELLLFEIGNGHKTALAHAGSAAWLSR